MDGLAWFLGGFLAVIAGIGVICAVLRNKVRDFSRRVFGSSDLLSALGSIDSVEADTPRSLNGCDTLLLPQILKDFPDFDHCMVKNYARDFLTEKLGGKSEFTIHNIVIAIYLPSAVQKTIVLQAAVSYLEKGRKAQKRYDLHYSYLVSGSTETVAANCPNCGGALGYGETVCPYCDSRVTNVMGSCWKFTQMKES